MKYTILIKNNLLKEEIYSEVDSSTISDFNSLSSADQYKALANAAITDGRVYVPKSTDGRTGILTKDNEEQRGSVIVYVCNED
jgi:hypothetical protein